MLGYGYLHTALDDNSRLACIEILPDEREDAAAFLARVQAGTLPPVSSLSASSARFKLFSK